MIRDHRIYLYYPFYFSASSANEVESVIRENISAITTRDLVSAISFPSDISVKASSLPERIWQDAKGNLSADFQEHVSRVLHGPKGSFAHPHLFYGRPPFGLTPAARNLLSGGWGCKGEGIRVQFRENAVSRVGVDSARFLIEDVFVYLLGTGIGIFLVEIRITGPVTDKGTLSFEMMTEVLYAIARGGKIASPLGFPGQEPKQLLTMETIVRSLLGPKKSLGFPDWQRVFTYCVLKVSDQDGAIGDWRPAAFRIAKKYTSFYLPSDKWEKDVHFQPFDNIFHCVSLEGGATIAEERLIDGKIPDFIRNFISDTSPKVYVPIALLAYQEYLKLTRMSQESFTPIDFKMMTKISRESLEKLQQDLLDFRLNYRFSHISCISMHNQVFDLWRKAFSLDGILGEVSQDVKEVASILKLTYDQKLQVVNRHQAALGIFLGMFVIFVSLLSTNLLEYQNICFASTSVLMSAIVFGGLGIIGALLYIRYSKE